MIEVLEPRVLLTGIVVNTNSDVNSAGMTLRDAITLANTDGGNDMITFDSSLAGKTITLTQGVLKVTGSMTISGLGASQLAIDGNGKSEIFDVGNQSGSLSQHVAITGLTVQHGFQDFSVAVFGAISNGATLNLADDTITSNSSVWVPDGAALFAMGAGIVNGGVLTSTNVTISHNTVAGAGGISGYSGYGGGVNNSGGAVWTSTNDTIIYNVANNNGYGGGIYNEGNLTITNDLIANNTADAGGGVFNTNGFGNSSLLIKNSTIEDNSALGAGGGIANDGSLTLIGNSVISNEAGPNGGGAVWNEGGIGTFVTAVFTSIGNTISGNSSTGNGGGVLNESGAWTSTNDTIANNSAVTEGGAIDNYSERYTGTVITTINDTITGNSSGSGLGAIFSTSYSTWNSWNTIVAGNTIGGDVAFQPAHLTINANDTLIGDTSLTAAQITSGSGNILHPANQAIFVTISGKPLLANNGGSTQTIALTSSSPAIGVAGQLAALSMTVADPAATTFVVSNITPLAVGDVLKVDNEFVAVTSIDSKTNAITVLRGQMGTIATTHNAAAALSLAYDQRGVIRTASDIGSYARLASTSSLSSSTASTVYQQYVTFTDVVGVVSPGTGTPTGTVTFNDGSTALGTKSLSVVNGHLVATLSVSSLPVGTHTITAVYSGDSNFDISTSPALTQSVVKANTSSTVTSSVASTIFGQSVTFTDTVSAVSPGSGAPTGTVTFYDGSTTLGTGSLSIVNGHVVATFSTSGLSGGTHSITAVYAGDISFNSSTSAALSQVVTPASTTSSLASSAASVIFGQSLTFTAMIGVISPGVGTPTGTVTFKDGSTTLGTGTLSVVNGHVVATFSTSSLGAGTHSISAVYAGDTNFTSSTSASLTQAVVMAGTTSTLMSSAASAVFGQSVTFTDTVGVVSPGSGTPTGTVTFKDGSVTLGTGTLSVVNGHVVATFTTSSLSIGTHSITAVYAGDGNFTGSTSSALDETIAKGNTVSTLSSSAASTVYGQSVTFTDTVGPVSPGAGTPTGTVKFYSGATVLGTGTLSVVNGHVVASITVSKMVVGTHSITAVYAGDGNFKTSTSAPLAHKVGPAATTSDLASSKSAVVVGHPVTFTVTVGVVSPGAGTPTGTATFYDGKHAMGTATLKVVNGFIVATFTTTGLAVGNHSIAAVYSGDAHFAESRSEALIETIKR